MGFTTVNRPGSDPTHNEVDKPVPQRSEQESQRRISASKRKADQLTPSPTTAKKPRCGRPKQSQKIKTRKKDALQDEPCNDSASDFTETARIPRLQLQLVPVEDASIENDSQSALSDVGCLRTTNASLASVRYPNELEIDLLRSTDLPDCCQACTEDCEAADQSHDAGDNMYSHNIPDSRYNSCLEDTGEDNTINDAPIDKLENLHLTASFDAMFEELLEDYANAESDDEFPIDEQDAQCLLQLPTVEEGFEPPSSLQVPFDDNSQTNEIYDPHLQYSRPSSSRSLRTIQVDGITIPVGNRTIIDNYRSSNSRSSQVFNRSSPCPNADNTDELYSSVHEDENLLDEVDSDFIDLETAYPESEEKKLLHPSPKPAPDIELPKLQWNPSTMYKPSKSIPTSDPALISSPVAKSQRLLLAEITPQSKPPPLEPHHLRFDSAGNALPFARPPFPSLVLDRSPILGVSSSSFLRTCFRIGEALNVATQAFHTSTHPLIELYARVTYSHRVGIEQFIQFADLFRSEKSPFLNGSFVGWKGVELWDNDSKAFLGDAGKGKVARCVGRMKRDETGRAWKIMVLSIWEADWEDVGFAKGIVCS